MGLGMLYLYSALFGLEHAFLVRDADVGEAAEVAGVGGGAVATGRALASVNGLWVVTAEAEVSLTGAAVGVTSACHVLCDLPLALAPGLSH